VIAEVVSVGTELLIGEIVDTNAAEIARCLGETGFDAHYQVTVGDNLDRIVAVLGQACARSDVVVVSGGIGPTQDDLTKDALCALAGVPMERDAGHAEVIRDVVTRRRGSLRETVLKMADLPAGAEPLPNANGLALGVALQCRGAWIFVLPGVPTEMRVMLAQEVTPRLVALSGGLSVQSHVVRTRGLGESEVAHRLDALFASRNPSIAFRIDGPEVHVRVTAKGGSTGEARSLAEAMAEQVRALLADAVV
jgi:nicotinamide-nucleotide amidase